MSQVIGKEPTNAEWIDGLAGNGWVRFDDVPPGYYDKLMKAMSDLPELKEDRSLTDPEPRI